MQETEKRTKHYGFGVISVGGFEAIEEDTRAFSLEADVIHYYLRQIVFPKTMQQQRIKITASGQELGSDMLFGRRLDFLGLHQIYSL